MGRWTLDQLTPADIINCEYCSRGSTPVEGSSTPVISTPIEGSSHSHGFLAEDEMPNTFMGLSLEEHEAEDEVPIMDATAEAPAVRRSQREKKACVVVDRRNEWQRDTEEGKGKEVKEKEV